MKVFLKDFYSLNNRLDRFKGFLSISKLIERGVLLRHNGEFSLRLRYYTPSGLHKALN